jgi:hypothetical protein
MADPEGRFKGLVPREGFIPKGKRKPPEGDISKNGIPRGKFFAVEEDWGVREKTSLQGKLDERYNGRCAPATALSIQKATPTRE